jgi:hypothetical protein
MPRAYRPFFLVVGLFALWVGAWGFAVPGEVSRALPWTVPPLHARFIAAIYLAGLLAMVWSFLATSLAEVRIPVALAALWTGALFLISMLHLGQFDFARPQVGFWMFAYAVFPLWGAWLYFRRGAAAAAEPRSPPRCSWPRRRWSRPGPGSCRHCSRASTPAPSSPTGSAP